MKEQNSDISHFSKAAIEFAAVANEYCNLLKASSNIRLKAFLSTLQSYFPCSTLQPACCRLSTTKMQKPLRNTSARSIQFPAWETKQKLGQHDTFLEVSISHAIQRNFCRTEHF
jgi:hypothetical protein